MITSGIVGQAWSEYRKKQCFWQGPVLLCPQHRCTDASSGCLHALGRRGGGKRKELGHQRPMCRGNLSEKLHQKYFIKKKRNKKKKEEEVKRGGRGEGWGGKGRGRGRDTGRGRRRERRRRSRRGQRRKTKRKRKRKWVSQVEMEKGTREVGIGVLCSRAHQVFVHCNTEAQFCWLFTAVSSGPSTLLSSEIWSRCLIHVCGIN